MNRRKFASYVVSGAFLGVVGGGYYWLNAPRDQSALGLDLMLDKLGNLARAPLEMTGDWDAARTFSHLAQSVEFSMAGYPEPKSTLFQNTAGKLAFRVFNARGAMSHGLNEPIPGETIDTSAETLAALDRLRDSLMTFRSYEAELKPHFAYGALSKDDYAIAHVLHINNHLEELKVV